MFGPQVEIANVNQQEGTSPSGYIFGEGMAAMWLTPDDKRIPHKAFKDGEWNRYRVVAQGARIQTWINDQPIGDLVDETAYKSHPKGFLGLQLHFGAGDHFVQFRNLRIRTLD